MFFNVILCSSVKIIKNHFYTPAQVTNEAIIQALTANIIKIDYEHL